MNDEYNKLTEQEKEYFKAQIVRDEWVIELLLNVSSGCTTFEDFKTSLANMHDSILSYMKEHNIEPLRKITNE